MFSTVRVCVKSEKMRGRLYAVSAKSRKNGSNLRTLPVFRYPISERGERRVYVWGLAEHGALGTTQKTPVIEGIRYIAKPRRLSFAEHHKVTDIICGYGFTAFAVTSPDKNIVYGSGINTDSQLGFQYTDEKFSSGLVTVPRPIAIPLEKSSTRVLDMAAGRAHLLVLTEEGLFTLGNNGYGQCGRPIIASENYRESKVIHRVADIKGSRIIAVAAGQDHSILLTDTGQVYTFGWGADGQTGLAHYRNEYRPSLVKGDLAGQRIVKVSSAGDCVLALSDKGQVFGWGNAEYEQLPAHGDNRQVNIAIHLDMCDKFGRIVDIAAGGSFCMILNDVGKVFVWGYGILGLGPRVDRTAKPTEIPAALFGKNTYERDSRVVKIYCGLNHLAALTNTGDLYTWGCNKYGSLGLGHRNDQYFPLKVAVGARVIKVACGIDHTATICEPFV